MGALAFGGAGRIAGSFSDFGSNPTHYTGGIGLRYMIAREQKFNIGFDITYGDENFAFYVQIGDGMAN